MIASQPEPGRPGQQLLHRQQGLVERLARLTLLISPALFVGAIGCPAPPADADGHFDSLAATHLSEYYEAHPVRATALGIHDHDGRLPSVDAAAHERRALGLRERLETLLAVDLTTLSADNKMDHRILEYAIRAELLEIEEVQEWRHNPLHYNRVMADGVATLIDREFAPLETRVAALAQRLESVPLLLETARVNLDAVPRLWAELAKRSTEGRFRS